MSVSDFIRVIDNAIPAELCQSWIEAFEQSPHRSAGQTGGGVDTEKKRSTDIAVSRHEEFRELLRPVMRATTQNLMEYFKTYDMAMISGLGLTMPDPATGELVNITHENFADVAVPRLPMLMQNIFRIGEINLQKYEQSVGGYPYWHSEVYPQLPNNEALHRVLLFMFYLNDVDDGGETQFLYQERSVEPRAGRMVIAPAHFTHSHRGCTPKSGDKYILTSWILFNSAEQIYRQAPN